jgi:NAD(P)-dependent dehydrogenase (short-subunit alcohol dehydrogenase family)
MKKNKAGRMIADRPVLITGASTGIGQACALHLDKLGFTVFAGIRKESDAQSLKRQASKNLTPVFIDVTDQGSILNAVETVSLAVGKAGLYGLVNNAGIVVAGPLLFLPVEQLRSQIEVNVLGSVAVTRDFFPLLRKGNGRIIFMSSIGGRIALPFLSPYSASKFALEAIADSLRLELKRFEVTVSIIEPGSVDTPIWKKSRAEADKILESLPADIQRHYAATLEAGKNTAEKVAAYGVSTADVARTVARALISRRPRQRYLLGWDTRGVVGLKKILPGRILDWIMIKILFGKAFYR